MKHFHLALVLLVMVSNSRVIAQNRNAVIESVPKWVTPIEYNAEATPKRGQEAGFYCLLLDEQTNIAMAESYTHIAYKILTTEGVQSMSDLTFNFDPTYQRLKLHFVRLRRGDELFDKIPSNIQTIQREQSMDRFLYDGSLTAVINITDVRVGDIVEYAFTKTGNNPVYEDHIEGRITFSYGFAYDKLFERLIVPESASLYLNYRNADIKPDIKSAGENKEYIWSLPRMDAYIPDNNEPVWYDGSQYVTLTDFDNWGEVAQWAVQHFQVPDAEQEALTKRISETFESKDKLSFVLDAIRFVQDDVRYLGFESGLNSHKPHSPLKVFEQRFGDCKDKSLLLCAMLNTAEIDAYPVLVNTYLRDKVESHPPSISAFNHCIVKIELEGRAYFVDPTINNQGGTPGNIAVPPYGMGLVIKDGISELDGIFSPQSSEVTEAQTIAIPTLEGEAYLNIITTYKGGEADFMRSQFLDNNAESIQKNYLTFYGDMFPDIELVTAIQHRDDRRANTFTVEENYKIPAFWRPSPLNEDILYSELFALSLRNFFSVTKSAQRTAPYRLLYPLSYQHSFNIKFPQEWHINADEYYIDNDYYRYEYYVRPKEKEVTIETHYRTKQDHVPMDAFATFTKDHEKMFSNLTFQLSYNKNMAGNEKGISWLGIIAAVISLGVAIWGVLQLYYYFDPEPASQVSGGGEKIGGWLVLVAIGLIISPIQMITQLFSLPEVYDSQTWSNLLALKRYGLYGFVLLAHIYNVVFFVYMILIIVLFFKRRSSLPKLITIYLAANCVMAIADTLIGVQNNPGATAFGYYRNMISGIVGAAIWIPYFKLSSRVQQTFVVRVNDDEDDETKYAMTVAAPGETTEDPAV